MSSLLTALVIAAAAVLVLARQFRPQRMRDGGHRWLVVPVVLVVFALRQSGGVLDAGDRGMSAALLAVELLVGLLMGAGWAWTSRIWTEDDGSVWTRGTKATAAVWILGIAVRLGLMGVGALIGVHQGSGALMLGLAASVLVRGGLLTLRAGGAGRSAVGSGSSAGSGPSYGGRTGAAPWKDRV